MIQSGPTGKNKTSLIWYVDFGASNHMTYPSASLTNVKPYLGNLQTILPTEKLFTLKLLVNVPHTLPLNHFFFKFLDYFIILYLLDNWLTTIAKYHSPNLVVLCRIGTRGR